MKVIAGATLWALCTLTSCKHALHSPVKPQGTPTPSLEALVTQSAKASHIPEYVLKSLIAVESSGNPEAERFERGEFYRLKSSPAFKHLPLSTLVDLSTSYGLMQVMGYHNPSNPQALRDPELNLSVGTSILKSYVKKCGNLPSALTAYNSGKCTSKSAQYLARIFG